jgi:tight adherence protein B
MERPLITLLLALSFGAGLGLLYGGLVDPRPPRPGPGPVARLLARAGLADVSPREFVLVSALAGLAAVVAAQVALGWTAVSVLAGVLGTAVPLGYYLRRQEAGRARVQAALVDALAQLRDTVRAGLSVEEGVAALSRGGPPALRAEFARLAQDARLDGFAVGLGRMRERLADPVFDIAAVALQTNDRLGGRQVVPVLDRLAQASRGELRVQEELRAYRARTVLSARVVAAVPVVLLVAIRWINPEYLAVFDAPEGQAVLALCAGSVAVGYGAMLWTARTPGQPRVLR